MGLIVNILNTETVTNLKHQDGKLNGKKINITNVKKVLLPAYNEYCLRMPGSTCDTGMPQNSRNLNIFKLYFCKKLI